MQARSSHSRSDESATPAADGPARRRSTVVSILISIRPAQWTKNLLVFAGATFGGKLLDPAAAGMAGATFAVFCALSGAVYIVNDLADAGTDREHPVKRRRPIASGELSTTTAAVAAGALVVTALAVATVLQPLLGLTAGAYVVLLTAYSVYLKHHVILDVLTIAAGFVLRAAAGAVAVGVAMSDWLFVCTTFLALFLALSKRRHELMLLADGATDHRPILREYSPYLLDQMIAVVTASTLVAYAVYATSADTAARLGSPRLVLTVPFVLYGIFRYLYLVHQKAGGGSPADLLLTDTPLLACVALWAGSVVLVLYFPM